MTREQTALLKAHLEVLRQEYQHALNQAIGPNLADQYTTYIHEVDQLLTTISGSPFDGLLSVADAAAAWDIDQSTVRYAIQSGKLIVDQDCKKYGKQWVVTIDAMQRAYGEPLLKTP